MSKNNLPRNPLPHVLYIPSWYPAHPADIAGSFFREQAIALCRAGCKVGVIAPSLLTLRKPLQALTTSREIKYELDEGAATYRRSMPNWTPRVSFLTEAQVRKNGLRLFENYVQEHGLPDIVHVHAALYAGVVAQAIQRSFGIPYVLSEHSSAFTRNRVSRSELQCAREVAVGADSRFAVSSPFARLLETRLSMEEQSWAVMPNSVDRAFLKAPINAEDTVSKNFLHVSLLDENKAVDRIIRAFAAEFRGQNDVRLTIGGNGPTRPQLMTLAQELGIGGQVRFPGMLSRDQVRAELLACSAFVLSSRFETFGVVLIEALAMGRPVIATRCGGPEDIVTEDDGILVAVDDHEALAQAMKDMLSEPSRFLAQALRGRCLRRFGPEALSARWCEVYRNVLAGPLRGHS